MNSLRSLLGMGLLGSLVVLCTGAGIGVAGPAASQPAGWKVTDDANWIGPSSWQRRFTIPPFVETPFGMDQKIATSRPSAFANSDYYAARSTRSVSDSTSSTGSSAKSSSGKSSSVSKSDRSSRRSSKSERSSSRRDKSSRKSRRSSRD